MSNNLLYPLADTDAFRSERSCLPGVTPYTWNTDSGARCRNHCHWACSGADDTGDRVPHTTVHESFLSRTTYLARCHSGGMIVKVFARDDDDVVLVVVVACQQLNRSANCYMFEPELVYLPFHALTIPVFKAQSWSWQSDMSCRGSIRPNREMKRNILRNVLQDMCHIYCLSQWSSSLLINASYLTHSRHFLSDNIPYNTTATIVRW